MSPIRVLQLRGLTRAAVVATASALTLSVGATVATAAPVTKPKPKVVVKAPAKKLPAKKPTTKKPTTKKPVPKTTAIPYAYPPPTTFPPGYGGIPGNPVPKPLATTTKPKPKAPVKAPVKRPTTKKPVPRRP